MFWIFGNIGIKAQVAIEDEKPSLGTEIRLDLLNSTLRNSVRIAASPLKFGWKQWIYTSAALGAVGLTMINDEWFQVKMGAHGGQSHPLSTYIGEPFGNPFVMTGGSLLVYAVSKTGGYNDLSQSSLNAFQSILIANGASYVLKLLSHRQRPGGLEHNANQWYGPSFDQNNLSFVSAHAATAFALASSVSTYYKDKKWIALTLYPLAAIASWSRVYENEHWFSDVFAGAILGYFIGTTISSPERYRWHVGPNTQGGMSLGFTRAF